MDSRIRRKEFDGHLILPLKDSRTIREKIQLSFDSPPHGLMN
jgi:hypothetical protein